MFSLPFTVVHCACACAFCILHLVSVSLSKNYPCIIGRSISTVQSCAELDAPHECEISRGAGVTGHSASRSRATKKASAVIGCIGALYASFSIPVASQQQQRVPRCQIRQSKLNRICSADKTQKTATQWFGKKTGERQAAHATDGANPSGEIKVSAQPPPPNSCQLPPAFPNAGTGRATKPPTQ
jgi:hypothetical protein